MKNNSQGIYIGSIIGLSIIVSVLVLSWTAFGVRGANDILSVTGSAKISVMSDKAVWNMNISRVVKESEMKVGYAKIANDLKTVKTFFATKNISENSIDIAPVQIYQNYDYSNNGVNKEREYTVSQTIRVSSESVDVITELSKNIEALINAGVFISSQNVEYYYSKLNEVRVSLLNDAIKDAKARASVIAESGGRKLGKLTSASSGVVQVLRANSVEISDYGNYDVSSPEKEIMVTAKASFRVK